MNSQQFLNKINEDMNKRFPMKIQNTLQVDTPKSKKLIHPVILYIILLFVIYLLLSYSKPSSILDKKDDKEEINQNKHIAYSIFGSAILTTILNYFL